MWSVNGKEFRALTDGEKRLAVETFGSSIDLDKVYIVRDSYFANQPIGTTVAPNGNIYFHKDAPHYRDDFSKGNVYDRAHFIHEMTHVWQSQKGRMLIIEGLVEWLKAFDYDRAYTYSPDDIAKSFSELNLEQQARFVEHWYLLKEGVPPPSSHGYHAPLDILRDKIPFIPDLRNVPLPPPRPDCFPSGTGILMADRKEKAISDIIVGDRIICFTIDGQQTSGVVASTYRNVTTEWLILRAADGSRDRLVELTCTPGHLYRRPDGSFMRIDEILALDGLVVWNDGSILKVVAERIVYSAETAHLYEQAEKVVYPTQGGLALQPEVVRGWRTYNFEVLEHHNYVAGGVQVHNESWPTLIVAREQVEAITGRDYTGAQADVDALMGAIMDGKVSAYTDYVGALHDERYGNVAYDAIRGKVEGSQAALDAGDAIAIQLTGSRLTSYNVRDGQVDWRSLVDGDGPDQGGTAYDDGSYRVDRLFPDGKTDYSEYFVGDRQREFAIDVDGAGGLPAVATPYRSYGGAEVGEFFGSYLGRAIGRGNTLAEIGAGTVLGLVMSKIGSAAEASIRGNLGVLGDGFDIRRGAHHNRLMALGIVAEM